MITPPTVVKIAGREYPLSWGNMAKFRFASIPYEQRALSGPSFLTQLVWAAYAGGVTHPCATWEHLAPSVADLSLDEYNALDDAMSSVLPPPPAKTDGEAKVEVVADPSTAEKKSDLTVNGPLPAAS
jgi:hypothetical protein